MTRSPLNDLDSLLNELEPHAGWKLLAILVMASVPWVILAVLTWGWL